MFGNVPAFEETVSRRVLTMELLTLSVLNFGILLESLTSVKVQK